MFYVCFSLFYHNAWMNAGDGKKGYKEGMGMGMGMKMKIRTFVIFVGR